MSRFVPDGAQVALEGFTHLIPFAAGHEIIRQGRRDLHLVRMTPDLIYDQLIGMGCARKLTFSWGGNPGVGSLHRLRDAVEHGWPRAARARRAQPRRHGRRLLRRRGAAAVRRAARLHRHRPASSTIPRIAQRPLPVYRRATGDRAGAQSRRHDPARAARRPRGQRRDRTASSARSAKRRSRQRSWSSRSRRSSTRCRRR